MKTTKHMTIRQKLNTEKAAGIVCTMPFIVGFLAFMIIPMCISLYYSFCDYNILQPPTFTGWANFKRMFSDATINAKISRNGTEMMANLKVTTND